jgi:hypothetical protein
LDAKRIITSTLGVGVFFAVRTMNYVCKIVLEDVEPAIWRTFRFNPDITFYELHEIIQIVMGWENCHMYEFTVKGKTIGGPWGYQNMLEILSNKKHVDYSNMREWLGKDFDAESCDLASINAELQALKQPPLASDQADAKAAATSEAQAVKKPTKAAVVKHLKTLSKEELIELLKEGYGASAEMKRILVEATK